MNDIKVALKMLPLLRGLYEGGVLDIAPSYEIGQEYIQVKESLFRENFPDVEEREGYLVTVLDGVKIIAVTDDVEM